MEIDNTEMLNTAHEVVDVAQLMLKRLTENADTPAKQETVERIREVVEVQSRVIRLLVEHNLKITDEIEKLVNKFNLED